MAIITANRVLITASVTVSLKESNKGHVPKGFWCISSQTGECPVDTVTKEFTSLSGEVLSPAVSLIVSLLDSISSNFDSKNRFNSSSSFTFLLTIFSIQI